MIGKLVRRLLGLDKSDGCSEPLDNSETSKIKGKMDEMLNELHESVRKEVATIYRTQRKRAHETKANESFRQSLHELLQRGQPHESETEPHS